MCRRTDAEAIKKDKLQKWNSSGVVVHEKLDPGKARQGKVGDGRKEGCRDAGGGRDMDAWLDAPGMRNEEGRKQRRRMLSKLGFASWRGQV